MKKKNVYLTGFWLLSALLVGLNACKGPQGDVGPQGTTGATGMQGAVGPQGVQGTANLIVSSWTTVAAADWKSDNNPMYFYYGVEDKNITQAIIDKGAVMAYYRSPAQKAVVLSLPSVTDKVSIGYFFRVDQGKGFMNFDLSYFQPRNVPINFDLEFRWIIIPPNPGGRARAIDWSNYDEVKRELTLMD